MKHYTSVVTGGTGFIGSHLAERLLKEGHTVTIIDKAVHGNMKNIQHIADDPSLDIVEEDLKKPVYLRDIVSKCDVVFHFAANPEVRIGESDPKVHFEENILTTFNVLEALRQANRPKALVFASTSTIYGEATQIPTPENYAPLVPISTYGASKLACEAMISGYAHTFNRRALILRLANIVGSRSTHGVIWDFIRKIRENPGELEILGDGSQEKSYLYITDCVEAVTCAIKKLFKHPTTVDVYNVGSHDKITVKEIAKIVAEEMQEPKIRIKFTLGVDGGRGWKGDVKTMQLSISKLLATGWKPRHTSKQAVRLTAKGLVKGSSA